MGFRFRRSVKLFPGVRLNFSKSGVSTSVGVRGAHVTVGHGQVRETVGLPGTGISYTEQHRVDQATAPPSSGSSIGALIVLVIFGMMIFAAAYLAGVLIR